MSQPSGELARDPGSGLTGAGFVTKVTAAAGGADSAVGGRLVATGGGDENALRAVTGTRAKLRGFQVGGRYRDDLWIAGTVGSREGHRLVAIGSVVSGALEDSNVDIATELTDMIAAQRSYTANSKVFQTGSDLMDILVNLKR